MVTLLRGCGPAAKSAGHPTLAASANRPLEFKAQSAAHAAVTRLMTPAVARGPAKQVMDGTPPLAAELPIPTHTTATGEKAPLCVNSF
jgi:hypothetical protein